MDERFDISPHIVPIVACLHSGRGPVRTVVSREVRIVQPGYNLESFLGAGHAQAVRRETGFEKQGASDKETVGWASLSRFSLRRSRAREGPTLHRGQRPNGWVIPLGGTRGRRGGLRGGSPGHNEAWQGLHTLLKCMCENITMRCIADPFFEGICEGPMQHEIDRGAARQWAILNQHEVNSSASSWLPRTREVNNEGNLADSAQLKPVITSTKSMSTTSACLQFVDGARDTPVSSTDVKTQASRKAFGNKGARGLRVNEASCSNVNQLGRDSRRDSGWIPEEQRWHQRCTVQTRETRPHPGQRGLMVKGGRKHNARWQHGCRTIILCGPFRHWFQDGDLNREV